MKKSVILIAILTSTFGIFSSANAKIPSCDSQLRQIAVTDFNIKGIKKTALQAELGDSEDNSQTIRIFTKTPTGANSTATLGWLKLDKNTYQMFDITNDDSNPRRLKIKPNQVKVFVNQCLQ